jgi:uncharacterized protein YjiS (DUF1127 family)
MSGSLDFCDDEVCGSWIGVPHYRDNLRRQPAAVALQAAILLGQLLSGVAVAVLLSPLHLLDAVVRRHERNRQRQVFARMDDHLLRDIGLTRCDLYDDLYRR